MVKETFAECYDSKEYKLITVSEKPHSNEYIIVESVQGPIVQFSVTNSNYRVFEAKSFGGLLESSYEIKHWFDFLTRLQSVGSK